jgi:hypothetical protein
VTNGDKRSSFASRRISMTVESSPARPSAPTRSTISRLAAVLAAMMSVAACSPGASEGSTAADDPRPTGTAVPSPTTSSAAPASAGPRTGIGFFAGSANVPVRFTIPPGWEMLETIAVVKSGADPVFGVAFYDVANIYADGCQWVLVDPPPGPTVDDLVTAYEKVPELRVTAARDVTVDEFDGKELGFTVPDYADDNCKDATYALVQADNAGTNMGLGDFPNLWAQAPDQSTTAMILDVDGTRLVIHTVLPRDTSAQDRADLDQILDSVTIG